MRIITCIFGAFLFFSLPGIAQAQTASQCTTSELDLVCDENQVLKGIRADGTKICVAHKSNRMSCRFCAKVQGSCKKTEKVCTQSTKFGCSKYENKCTEYNMVEKCAKSFILGQQEVVNLNYARIDSDDTPFSRFFCHDIDD